MLHPGLDAQRRFESGRRAGITMCVNTVLGVLIAYVGVLAISGLYSALVSSHNEARTHGVIFGVGLYYGFPILLGGIVLLVGVLGVMTILSDLPGPRPLPSRRMVALALDVGSVWFLWIGPMFWVLYAASINPLSVSSPLLLSIAVLFAPFMPSVLLPILWTRAAMRGLNALTP